MKVVALVPIKLNSERLKNKNLLDFDGKPLAWHITNTLSQVAEINETYVFCSDPAVKKYISPEVQFLKRDKSLDENEVKGFEIYDAFINKIDADIYILAHTTSPLLKKDTIAESIQKVISGEYDSALSVKKIQTFAWYNDLPINYNLNDVPRTQDMTPIYIETSGFYIFRKELFKSDKRRIGFKPFLKEVDDLEAIDIDTKEDYDFALKMLIN